MAFNVTSYLMFGKNNCNASVTEIKIENVTGSCVKISYLIVVTEFRI